MSKLVLGLLGLWPRSSHTLLNPCSSESDEDDVHERQDERRRGNTSWCVCECCANWERQQEKECSCCKEIEEAVNKFSGE